jgi:hypothetical protein
MLNWSEREILSSLAVTTGLGCLMTLAAYHVMRQRTPTAGRALSKSVEEQGEEEEEEAPELFIDVISHSVMTDPACLVGTGQVYDYSSIRAWLCTGARKCPRTNLALVDVEVGEGEHWGPLERASKRGGPPGRQPA